MNLRRLLSAVPVALAICTSFLVPSYAPAVAHGAATSVTPGAGWYLTVVYRGPIQRGGVNPTSQRLELVSPTGETTTVLSRAVTHGQPLSLAEWSPDGRTALLVQSDRHAVTALRVDVATGTTSEYKLPNADAVMLDPDGSGIVYTGFTDGDSGYTLTKVDWAGASTRLPIRVAGSILAGPGDTIIDNGDQPGRHVMRVISLADGSVVHQFRPGGYCNAVRWWDGTHLLATCGRNLALIDPTTGARTPLTTQHGSGDYGHLDARELSSGLYVQVAGACGYTYIGHQSKDGSVRPVHVPGAVGNVVMVGTAGRDLVIQHEVSCDGAHPVQVLSRFNPVTHQEKVLVELGRHQSFGVVRGFGETWAVQT